METGMSTVVKIIDSYKGPNGISMEKLRAVWRTVRPQDAPEAATVCLLDLCDEVDRLRTQKEAVIRDRETALTLEFCKTDEPEWQACSVELLRKALSQEPKEGGT
jgi:hypothetical protein